MIAVADDGGDGQTVIATTQTSPWSGSMSDLPAVNFTVFATVKLRSFADPSVAVTIASAPAQVKVGGTKKPTDAGKLIWDKGYPLGGKLLITGKGTYELLNSDWEIVGKIKIVAYVTGGGSTPGPNEIDPVPDKLNPLKGTWGPVQISAVPGTYTVIAEMKLENLKLKSKTTINTKVITNVTVTSP